MESIINKPVHIEFYGMPGSGKSTIAARVSDKLIDKGFKIKEPSRQVGDEICRVKRVVIKLYRAVKYCISHPRRTGEISKLIKKCGYVKKDYFVHFINVVAKKYQYSIAKKSTFYVWDEGLFQSGISLAVNKKVSINEILNKLIEDNKEYNLIIPVYIKSDMEIVNSRLKERKNGNSRVERESSLFKKLELLKEFNCVCNQLEMGILINNNHENAEDAAAHIVNSIFS